MTKTFKTYIEIILLIITGFSPLLPQPIKAVLVLILFILNLKYAKRLDKKKLFTLGVFMYLFILNFIYDLSNISAVDQINILSFYFPLCFLLGFLISQKYSIKEYLYYYEKVIFIIAIFSLIGVALYIFFPDLLWNLPEYNYYHTNHKTAFLFNILISGNSIVKRNAGIAWEPGAFQFLLNLGLYSYIENNEKINLFRVAIYAMAIIFTRSTAGLIIFLLVTFKIFMDDKKARVLIIMSVLIFSVPIIEELFYQIRYKLVGSYAFNIRLQPFLNAFNIGKNYFLGMGNSGFDIYYRNKTTPPWDSIGQIFIRYGYVMLIYILFTLSNLLKQYKLLFFILLITFFSQNIWFFSLVTPFYFYGISCYDINKSANKSQG